MPNTERIHKALDNARENAQRAFDASSMGRVDRANHLAIVSLAEAIEELAGGAPKAKAKVDAKDDDSGDAAPAKKAPAKKSAAKKAPAKKS